MAGSSLLVLIDDIAAVLDDVATMTKVAAKKTAGVLGDDLAVNAEKVTGKIDSLVAEIDAELQPVKDRGYVVFHDAYHYFETRFEVSAVGSITASPEVMPGAERVRQLQEKVRSLDATCVFSEPQFEPKLVATVTENTKAGTGVLDPLGATITAGPELYFALIRNLADSMRDCLS